MVDYQAGKNKLYLKGDVSQIVNIKHAYQINTNALFISAAYNLWNNEAFSVFGSASVGGAYHNLKLHDSTFTISSVPLSSYKGTVSKTNFAWNVGIGSLINLSEYMKLNLSYQYVDLGSLPTTNLTNQSDSSADVRIRLIENKIRSQNVGLSLLYKF
jgi:opacity protein-like surface antigen